MFPSSLRLAYCIPAAVALALAFFAMVQIDQLGIVGPSTMLTVTESAHPGSNQQFIDEASRTARRTGATLARTVADRTAPSTRRTLVVTDAAGSRGRTWLRDGYRDFDPSMSTAVRSIDDELRRLDPSGDYAVVGDARAARAFAEGFRHAGYDVHSEAIPPLHRLAFEQSSDSAVALIAITSLGGVMLCAAGTLGAPRRSAVRRLHGHSQLRSLCTEFAGAAATQWTTIVLVTAMGVVLAFVNASAQVAEYAVVAASLWFALLVPVVLAHGAGVVIANRLPLVPSVRGARPAGFVVRLGQIARVPAVFLLISACFSAVGSIAVTAAAIPERDIAAARDAVQLWVAPDASHEGTAASQGFWNDVGAMARDAIAQHDAILAATGDISPPTGTENLTALFVDGGYLEVQDLRNSDGLRIAPTTDTVDVWVPDTMADRKDEVTALLGAWELRNAKPPAIRATRVGVLAPGQQAFAYPGDPGSAAWLGESEIVVVPSGALPFTDDDLGSWISSGDVVFTDESAALHAMHRHALDRAFSAVVPVAQTAAERARTAAVTARVDVVTAAAALTVTLLATTLSITAHRRRFGTTAFVRYAAGWSFARTNRSLLATEAAFLVVATIVAANTWWDRRPDPTGRHSGLDPVAASASSGLIIALLTVAAASLVSTIVLATTGRHAIRNHGRET